MKQDTKYNKRRARTAEFHQQQVDEEVANRVDEILSNLAEKKKQQELKEEKRVGNSIKSEEEK